MGRQKTSVIISQKRAEEILRLFDYTKKDLGELLGYSREAISKSFNRETMDEIMLRKLCNQLDIHPDYLTGKDVPNVFDLDSFTYSVAKRNNRIDCDGNYIDYYSSFKFSEDEVNSKNAFIQALRAETINEPFQYESIDESGNHRIEELDYYRLHEYYQDNLEDLLWKFRIMVSDHIKEHWEEWIKKYSEDQ